MTSSIAPLTPLVAAELRAARARARRTLAWVAEQTGVSTRHLIRLFNGERSIDVVLPLP